MALIRDAGGGDVRVFGSVARGDDHVDSDIDLLFRMNQPLSLMTLSRLESSLAVLLGSRVDLVPESTLSPVVRDRVLAEALPL
ncbi:MAG: nucleotidyltransferase domain-containing protein [Micrococcus sp.]|nr:nucleotidyltransferase domain-containing protein [Micrococcus sp.]